MKCWRDLLTRIVSVVKPFSSRGLPFRGDDQKLESTTNDLFLGCFELISEFDPFLSQHHTKYGNKDVSHKARGMEEATLNMLEELKLDFKNSRVQSYDNVSNIPGVYSGLQSIIQENVSAEFVPCAALSLNFAGRFSAEKASALNLLYSFLLYKDCMVFFRHLLTDRMY
ncbi:DUF4371 domain-containing protein [Trichonephila clavipes]|nr:DUF4371 domain-containing protein [Trichonephila clavipes]